MSPSTTSTLLLPATLAERLGIDWSVTGEVDHPLAAIQVARSELLARLGDLRAAATRGRCAARSGGRAGADVGWSAGQQRRHPMTPEHVMQAEPPSGRPPTAGWDPPRLPGPTAARGATQLPPRAGWITRSSYGVPPGSVWLHAAAFAGFAVAWAVAPLLAGDTSAVALVLGPGVGLLAAGWVVYSKLFRDAYLLELSATELRWYAPLRRGAVPLRELREVRPGTPWCPAPMLLVGNVTFTTRSGQTFVADTTARGFGAFVEDLRRAAPDARIDVGRGRSLVQQRAHGYRRDPPGPARPRRR
ncbi:MAG TPA: hypothetical protein VKG45_01825 [Actinomycetes bacterium]|nr:hypothetical protein [Actinomycetes bacterium]